MDTFMDKLAQKFTAQEIIKANAAAEAAELERVRSQVQEYNDCLQEMKQVNNDTKAALDLSLDRIRELQVNTEEIQNDIKEQTENQTGEITDFVHKENVKVYRNVQAVIVEELRKQSESLDEQLAVIAKKQKTTCRIAVTSLIFMILTVGALTVQLLMEFGILVF